VRDKIKQKLEEARKSTKVAFVGGAVVVAGTWGSCQLQYDDHSQAQNAVQPQEDPPEEVQQPEEAEAEAEAEEALEEATE
tara:strand:+ start:10000 stop:10239 length:240 start_codon:yes stop_codon:yes gene_type:complete